MKPSTHAVLALAFAMTGCSSSPGDSVNAQQRPVSQAPPASADPNQLVAEGSGLKVTRAELEDLYLPYKPKRRTKASIARDKGLEPLANFVWEQQAGSLSEFAATFVNAEKEVNSVDEALEGARHIIADIRRRSIGKRSARIGELRRRLQMRDTYAAEDIR